MSTETERTARTVGSFVAGGLAAQTAVDKIIAPQLEEIPKAKAPFELWATIRKTSKYYSQGVNEKGKPVAFPIRSVLLTDCDGYDFKGGPGGAYRRQDVQLWIACGSKLKKI